MSTSFYATPKLTPEQIEVGKQYLTHNRIEALRELLPQQLMICHCAHGWEILWYAHNFEYFDKSKESLFNFLKDCIIYDEYGKEYDFDEFYEEIKDFLNTGLNYESYYSDGKHSAEKYWYRNYGKVPIGVDANEYGEFWIDGLRFINE